MRAVCLRLSIALGALGVVVTAARCGPKSTPAAPTPVQSLTTSTGTLAGPMPYSPAHSDKLTDATVLLTVDNARLSSGSDEVKYRFQWSEVDSFPEDSRTGTIDDITQGGPDRTDYQITDTLKANFKYYWRAQGYTSKVTSDWSETETFITYSTARCLPGPDIFDPLTEGRSLCATSILGGHFIQGQGWQANGDTDGLNYDIPTCSDCTVEFDATNFGRKEGEFVQKDLKWISMGDATTWGDFIAFRNHPWKMHLEQRSDGDGTGMKMIWRNGDAGEGEPGDHTGKVDPGVNWNGNTVFHFILTWRGGSGFTVKVGETQPDGTVTNLRTWFQDGFGGHPYSPPNHRIQLGCSARNETMFNSAIWRNVKIYHN
jgi:hypothetical protein